MPHLKPVACDSFILYVSDFSNGVMNVGQSSLILKLFLLLITVALYSSIVAGTLVLQQELFLRRGHR